MRGELRVPIRDNVQGYAVFTPDMSVKLVSNVLRCSGSREWDEVRHLGKAVNNNHDGVIAT
jgi:hypothetical protein